MAVVLADLGGEEAGAGVGDGHRWGCPCPRGAMMICGKARYHEYSPLSPGSDIPPGGERELMFYGKLRANVDARKRVPPQLTMP